MRLKHVLFVALAACTSTAPPPKSAGEVAPKPAAPPSAPTPTGAQPPAPSPAPLAAPRPRPKKVKIIVRSIPPKAFVFWGKKNLGPTPVTLERPTDSGPVDLVVRAEGYFPLHTRAYTVKNDPILVRLTRLADRMSIFGAKKELPPEPSPSPAPTAP
jgi:hypothetical protein